ncbi:tctex1 domain-containing protein 2 [Apteryx rowi]|uniref:tctex1 domain-containing protein 2 n=1 Tax=Apteryx rowi TaxID=308060 RepID=UPI000E1D6C65|nr:tctex1 domain-containing protein 2 [Apteryx rowi]
MSCELSGPFVAVFCPVRFKSSTVKECIHAILKEKLTNVQYIPEEMPQLTKSLSEMIKDRLKDEGFDRYKMVVQVVIGEQRGEGVNMAARCFWDADTDSYAHDVFMNFLGRHCLFLELQLRIWWDPPQQCMRILY